MPLAEDERRGTRRFALRLPVSLHLPDHPDVQAQTKNVSARGVYFFSPETMEEGKPLEFTLTLPPEITLTSSVRVRCRGRAIRVEPDAAPDGRMGVAVVIDDYQFLS
jgi:hypothetical protein